MKHWPYNVGVEDLYPKDEWVRLNPKTAARFEELCYRYDAMKSALAYLNELETELNYCDIRYNLDELRQILHNEIKNARSEIETFWGI